MGRHTLSVLTNNHPGVLQRVCGLFSRRSYNIESITVGASEKEGIARMTIVAEGDRQLRNQLVLQLNKLIDVIDVVPLEQERTISRELMLVQLKCEPEQRREIMSVLETFRCSVADLGAHTMMVQIVGETAQNNALLQLLAPYGILQLSRTGETSMAR